MANKSNRRYKARIAKPRNNRRLFDTPPVLISTWEELDGLESENYKITVDENGWSATVSHKYDKDVWSQYLSTHTFYSGEYLYWTSKLRRLGFNIQLKNWDGETLYCRY